MSETERAQAVMNVVIQHILQHLIERTSDPSIIDIWEECHFNSIQTAYVVICDDRERYKTTASDRGWQEAHLALIDDMLWYEFYKRHMRITTQILDEWPYHVAIRSLHPERDNMILQVNGRTYRFDRHDIHTSISLLSGPSVRNLRAEE